MEDFASRSASEKSEGLKHGARQWHTSMRAENVTDESADRIGTDHGLFWKESSHDLSIKSDSYPLRPFFHLLPTHTPPK